MLTVTRKSRNGWKGQYLKHKENEKEIYTLYPAMELTSQCPPFQSYILETKNCARKKNVVMNRNKDNLFRNDKYYQEWRETGEWEEIPKILSIHVYRPLYCSCLFHICMWWAFLVRAVFLRGNPGGIGLPIFLCKLTRVCSVCSVWGPNGEGFPSLLFSYVHYFVSVSNSHCLDATQRKKNIFTVLFLYREQILHIYI